MKKGRSLLIGIGFIIFFILGFLSYYYFIDSNSCKNYLSQCYTQMQPSRFLKSAIISPISTNDILNITIIKINNREFSIEQISNSGSMHPAIADYSEILLIVPKKEDIFIGDIIVFETSDNKKIVHRVINISNEYYITKGDNNALPDDYQTKFEDIRGKVIAVFY